MHMDGNEPGCVMRVIRNTGFLYMKMGITMFVSLYSTRLILEGLGIRDFGIFNVIGGVIAMLGFLNASMAAATQRFMSYAEGAGDASGQKAVFNVSLLLHLGIAVAVGLLLHAASPLLFGHVLNVPADRIEAARFVYGTMIAGTMVSIAGVPWEAVLNAHENMLYFAGVGILESILKLGAALAVVHAGADRLMLYGMLQPGITVAAVSCMVVYCLRKYRECVISPRRYWRKKIFREMGSFAGWNLAAASGSMLSEYGVGLILNHFFGVVLNAAQAVAQQINGQTMAFSATMLKALNPVIAKSEGAGNRRLMLRASLTGCKFGCLLLAVFAVPFMIEAPGLLSIWLHAVPEWAVLFCRLQLFRTLLEQLFLSLGSAIYAEGNIRAYTLFKAASGLLFLAATYGCYRAGLPPWMMYVAAILVVVAPGGVFSLVLCVRRLGLQLREFFSGVLAPCLFPIAAAIAVGLLLPLFCPAMSPFAVLLRTSAVAVAFLLAVYLLSLDARERALLASVAASAWKKLPFTRS